MFDITDAVACHIMQNDKENNKVVKKTAWRGLYFHITDSIFIQ